VSADLKGKSGNEGGRSVEGEGRVGGEEDGLDLVPVVLDVDAAAF
jgi:hypothetical protein